MSANNRMATPVQDRPLRKNDSTDMHHPDLLAKWPVIGIVMFIFGSLMFGGLLYNLRAQGPLLAWDRVIANSWPAIALKSPAFVRTIMDAGFYVGDQVILVLAILLAVYFIYKRFWQELVMVTFGMAGSSVLFLSLSNLIARQRPPTQIWIIVNVPGFPSGHASGVIVFYGLLAYLLVSKMRSVLWKVVAVVAALLIIVFVGFSRVFTGGHYLTDVLAGYAVGIAWSGLIYTLIEIYFQKRRIHNVKTKS